VHAQDRQGVLGHVQGEKALAKLAHGYQPGRDPYGPGSFPKPYLPGEEAPGVIVGEAPVIVPPVGGDQGMGSRTQADVTPGEEPTKKPEGGA
jgi:hypothetical protein